MRAAGLMTLLVVAVLPAVVAGCSVAQLAATRPVVANVRNADPVPVELTVDTPAGVVLGAVQPSRLAPKGSARVTFHVPAGTNWWIKVNGSDMFPGSDVVDVAANCTTGMLTMEVSSTGAGSIGC